MSILMFHLVMDSPSPSPPQTMQTGVLLKTLPVTLVHCKKS